MSHKMKCGGCGCETATVRTDSDRGSHPFYTRIVLTCTKCGSSTELKLTAPRIEARNVEGDGTFCVWGS